MGTATSHLEFRGGEYTAFLNGRGAEHSSEKRLGWDKFGGHLSEILYVTTCPLTKTIHILWRAKYSHFLSTPPKFSFYFGCYLRLEVQNLVI